jgi:hypothetical protein
LCTDRLAEQHEHQTQGRGIVYRQTHRATSTSNTGKGYCEQTDSQSNMNTKPRGGVVCTERLAEQHEHQTQGRGSLYRQTHRATSTPNPWEGYRIVHRQTHRGGVVCRQTQSNMNTKPRGEVLCTDRHRAIWTPNPGEGYCVDRHRAT